MWTLVYKTLNNYFKKQNRKKRTFQKDHFCKKSQENFLSLYRLFTISSAHAINRAKRSFWVQKKHGNGCKLLLTCADKQSTNFLKITRNKKVFCLVETKNNKESDDNSNKWSVKWNIIFKNPGAEIYCAIIVPAMGYSCFCCCHNRYTL